MQRVFVLFLVAATTAGLWQLVPESSVQAGPPVDQQIARISGAPASFADVIEAVQPAVVNISFSGPARPQARGGSKGQPGMDNFEDFLRRFFERQNYPDDGRGAPTVQGMGSGFIIAPEGYVVTNHHVIQAASEIAVTLGDGTRLEAELVGTDPKTDLAVLKVSSEESLPYASFGNSDDMRVGDWVIAIGNPFGLGGSATTGIVSARGRDIRSGPFDDFLQIDAPINRGNSGGPLFDLNGQVIGINTAIYSPNGGNVGIGFAIPSKLAESVIEELRSSGRVERGWLGVTIQPVDEAIAEGLGFDGQAGALVASVVPGSPAERAGLRPGDVIVGFADEAVTSPKALTRHAATVKPGTETEIEVWRDGVRETLEVAMGRSPSDPVAARAEIHEKKARLGIALAELTPEGRERFRIGDAVKGALIVNVDPAGPAAAKGLRPGDVIVGIGQRPVDDLDAAIRAIEIEAAAAKEDGRGNILLRVARGGDSTFVAIPFG